MCMPHDLASPRPWDGVKNGFSDLTKEQEGRDWQGKDVMNEHQGKALREGCHEIKEAWVGVSVKFL